jgi:PHO85 cyclin-5
LPDTHSTAGLSRGSGLSDWHCTSSQSASRPTSSSNWPTVIKSGRSVSTSSPSLSQIRDVQKARNVVGLIDQAVKCLCKIRNPSDIPSLFQIIPSEHRLSVPRETTSVVCSLSGSRIAYLLSPITPNTRPSPMDTPSVPYSRPSNAQSTQDARRNLALLKGFVHEVLPCTCTSICYFIAIY